MSKIARRKFIQLSAAAAAGCFMTDSRKSAAQELPKLEESDPMAQAMKYTRDASTVDPSAMTKPDKVQTCDNCALVQGDDGEDWRPCQIFPGKLVAGDGWCSVWALKT
ncbi:MAG: high-potential iron-sulfur protein [Woeseiaceae bacterium]